MVYAASSVHTVYRRPCGTRGEMVPFSAGAKLPTYQFKEMVLCDDSLKATWPVYPASG